TPLFRAVVLAAHRGAAADPAGVEAHQVVAGAQGREVGAEGRQGGDTGAARSAEVEDQGPDALVPRAVRAGADQLDADRVALGLVPVERRLHGGALPRSAVRQRRGGRAAALGLGRGGAVLPAELLLRQVLRLRVLTAAGEQCGQQHGGDGQGGGTQAEGLGHASILRSRGTGRATAGAVRGRAPRGACRAGLGGVTGVPPPAGARRYRASLRVRWLKASQPGRTGSYSVSSRYSSTAGAATSLGRPTAIRPTVSVASTAPTPPGVGAADPSALPARNTTATLA